MALLIANVPEPALIIPADPASTTLMVATFPRPKEFTVIVGVGPASVFVRVPETVQPAAEEVSASPKERLFTCADMSNVTVESAVISCVLKSTAALDELGTVVGFQLAGKFQFPEALPLFKTLQVSATRLEGCRSATMSPVAVIKV